MGSCGAKQKPVQCFLLQTLDDHEGRISCMALNEDGSILATGSEDKTARLWTTKTYTCECAGILEGHEGAINTIAIENNYVLTGSADHTVRKWDMATCECVHVFQGHSSNVTRVICVDYYVFTCSFDQTARCWDFNSGQCLRIFIGHKRGVYHLIYIPPDEIDSKKPDPMCDGLLITGSADGTAKSFSLSTAECLNTFKDHNGVINCMLTDARGRVLFTGASDGSIRSWNIFTGEIVNRFEGHQASVLCMILVNKTLYSGSADYTSRAWDTETAECMQVYKGHKIALTSIQFQDGLIFTGNGDGDTRIFDAKTGTLMYTFKGHTTTAGQLGNNSRSNLQIIDDKLFSCSEDSAFRIWDLSDIKPHKAKSQQDAS